MKFQINITKTRFFVLLGAVLLLIGALGVYASHTTGTPVPGHDINQIGGIPSCNSGQVLTHAGPLGIRCVDDIKGGSDSSYPRKLCVVLKQGPDPIRDTIEVPNIWIPSNCADYAQGMGVFYYQLGCVHVDGTISWSNGGPTFDKWLSVTNKNPNGAQIPSPNCGWVSV